MKISSVLGDFKVLQDKDDATRVVVLSHHKAVLGRLNEMAPGVLSAPTETGSECNAFMAGAAKADFAKILAGLAGTINYTRHGPMLSGRSIPSNPTLSLAPEEDEDEDETEDDEDTNTPEWADNDA